MANYSFEKFTSELKKEPTLLVEIISFIEYVTTPASRKMAQGKTPQEFANVLSFLVENNKLSQDMLKFLAERIFYYLESGKIAVLQQRLAQVKQAKNVAKSLSPLRTLLDSSAITQRSSQIKKSSTFVSSDPPKIRQRLETFISSPVKSITRMFKKNVSPLSNRFETILGTNSPLESDELEDLRAQTLVSLNNKQSSIKWIALPQQDNLKKSKPKDFVKTLKGFEVMSELSREQRQVVSSLRNSLLIRAKLLTEEEIICNIINQGKRSFYHTLNRLSNLTNHRGVNKKSRSYLLAVSDEKLKKHAEIFRDRLDKCNSLQSLDSNLGKYTLASSSIYRLYADLRIIRSVKQVRDKFNQNPQKLEALMNKYLGTYGEANLKVKLNELLASNIVDAYIYKQIHRTKNVSQAVEALRKISSHNDIGKTATKVIHLLERIIDSGNRVSFQNFQTSLNFVSDGVRTKLQLLVRKELKDSLLAQVSQVSSSSLSPSEKLMKVRNFLQNPCYHDSEITLFGESPFHLDKKIDHVKGLESQLSQMISYHFPNPKIPSWFFEILEKGKSEEINSGKKTSENCYRDLGKIERRFERRELYHLRGELVNLFKLYGSVSFADIDSTILLNGYSVAKSIQDFYNQPNRTTIELPSHMQANIRDLLKKMIDKERARQVKKL